MALGDNGAKLRQHLSQCRLSRVVRDIKSLRRKFNGDAQPPMLQEGLQLKKTPLISHTSSAAWAVIELACSIGAQLILTPLLLNRLGVEQFGVWIIALTVLVGSATLSLGTGTALLPILARANARGDTAGAWAAVRLFTRRTMTSAIVLLLVISTASSLDWVPATLPGRTHWDLWILASSMLGWAVVSEIDNGLSSALKARDRFDASALAEVGARIAQVGLTFLLLRAGDSALIPIILVAAVTAIKAAIKFMLLRVDLPQFAQLGWKNEASKERSASVTEELGASGRWIWLGLLSGLLFNAFDRWLVAAQLGAATLAAYATCAQIAQMPHALAAAAGQTLAPWAARRRDRLAEASTRQEIRRVLLIATAAAALPSLTLLPILRPLLGWWISKDFAAENLSTAEGMTLGFCLLAMNVPAYFLLFGLGRMRTSTILSAMSGCVFVGGCLLIPPSVLGLILMKGLFAALTLSLTVSVLVLTKVRQ